MAITKEVIIGQIEIVGPFKNVQVRTDTVVKEDGTELSRSFHRHALSCGTIDESDNFVDSDISGEDAEVQAICNSVWTQAIKDAWKARLIADKSQENNVAEIICTHVHPKDLMQAAYGESGEYIMNLVKSIKKDGLKFPIVCECTDKKYKAPYTGYKRLLIALALGFKKIPVVLWSQHNKTGHQGKLINEQSDILDILGKEIENNLTHEHIVGAYRKLPYPKNTI